MTKKTRADLKKNPAASNATFADTQVLSAQQILDMADSMATLDDDFTPLKSRVDTSVDTDGTLKAGAVDNAAVVADSVLTYAKMAADAKFNDYNTLYECRGVISWNPQTHVFTLGSRVDIVFGQDSNSILSCTEDIVIDFDDLGANYQFAYITGVDRADNDTFAEADVVVETRSTLSVNVQDKTVIVLAVYNPTSNTVWSPFMDAYTETRFLTFANTFNMPGFTKGLVEFDPVTEQLRFHEDCFWFQEGIGYTKLAGPATIDFSGDTDGDYVFAYIVGVDMRTGSSQDLTDSSIVVESRGNLSVSLQRHDVLLVASYQRATGELWSPFLAGKLGRAVLRKPQFRNNYPNIYSKIPNFTAKYLAGDDDINIVLWGDSLFARTEHTSSWGIDPTALPPTIQSKNLAWWLWTYGISSDRKAAYRRYDYTSFFTETGTWVTSAGGDNTGNSGPDTNWDDEGDRSTSTRISDSSNAAVEWTLAGDDDKTGFSLIYRTDTNGDAAATVTVGEGDGYVEAWNGSSWVEANAYTFSMLETDGGDRQGNTIFQKRQKFRKADAHVADSVTVSIGKAAADSDRLLYWGIEYYPKARAIVRLINVARGGHSIDATGSKLYDYMDDDVIGMAPDLVLFELPLLNQSANGSATRASVTAAVQDVVWGDRAGNTNSWALLQNAETGDNEQWDDFEVLLVIPHHSQSHFDSDGNFQVGTSPMDDGESAKAIYDAVKALIISQGDVGYIDISTAMLRAIDADTVGNYYEAMNGTSDTEETYTTDDVHQNDKGTRVWAGEIVPVFHFTNV